VDAQEISSVVLSHFGVHVRSLLVVEGGLDPRARLWQAIDESGDAWTIKATSRNVKFGLAIVDALSRSGVPGVAEPLRGHDGRPWAEHRGAIVSVSPWIPGLDATDSVPSLAQWRQLGQTLRDVHEYRVPVAVNPHRRGIRRSGKSPRELVADIDRRMSRVQGGAGNGHEHWAELWRANRPRVRALLDLERALKGRRRTTQRVPVHGDPHLGNVVIDESGRPWLIDFDQASIAPREVDLMLIELGVIFSAPVTDVQRRAFRSGYGEDFDGEDFAIDDDRILRFGCVRAVEDIAATMRALLRSGPGEDADLVETLRSLFGPAGLMALVEDRAVHSSSGETGRHARPAPGAAPPHHGELE
jgi:spectinomycin phosphotransferase